MTKLSNVKDINTTTLHNGNQIADFIKIVSNEFSDNNDIVSLEKANLIYSVFCFCPTKLHPLFGNNMAKTTFPSYFNKILMKYQDQSSDETLKILLISVISVVWNLTDSSEIFCKQLISCENFAKNLVYILCETEYNEKNKQIVDGTLSIINNIIRRDLFRHFFDDVMIIDRITELQKSTLMGRNLRIICVVIVFLIIPVDQLKQIEMLVDDIRKDVIEIIDAASNTNDFTAEGFGIKELMGILSVICKDTATKKSVECDQTLSLALLRLLSKKCYPENVISLAKKIYTDKQFEGFRQNYVDKYGQSNKAIIDEFKRSKNGTPPKV